jgi:hypothetical protein
MKKLPILDYPFKNVGWISFQNDTTLSLKRYVQPYKKRIIILDYPFKNVGWISFQNDTTLSLTVCATVQKKDNHFGLSF